MPLDVSRPITRREFVIDYISPLVCHEIASASGDVEISILPFDELTYPSGLLIEGTGPYTLSWNVFKRALCYNVYRALSPTGPFQLISSCQTGRNFSDDPGAGTFYYTVTVVTPEGETPQAPPVVTGTSGPPPDPDPEEQGWEYETNWNPNPADNAGVDFPAPCPWPVDFNTVFPDICNAFDPYVWPLIAKSPDNGTSTIATGDVITNVTVDSSAVGEGSTWDRAYLRLRVEGGATGKHVAVSGDYMFPGGQWTESAVPVDALFRIFAGLQATSIFSNAFLGGNPSVELTLEQSAAQDGLWSFEDDVAPGDVRYICVLVESRTRTFGESLVNFQTTITDL